jgi:hypothetical protein
MYVALEQHICPCGSLWFNGHVFVATLVKTTKRGLLRKGTSCPPQTNHHFLSLLLLFTVICFFFLLFTVLCGLEGVGTNCRRGGLGAVVVITVRLVLDPQLPSPNVTNGSCSFQSISKSYNASEGVNRASPLCNPSPSFVHPFVCRRHYCRHGQFVVVHPQCAEVPTHAQFQTISGAKQGLKTFVRGVLYKLIQPILNTNCGLWTCRECIWLCEQLNRQVFCRKRRRQNTVNTFGRSMPRLYIWRRKELRNAIIMVVVVILVEPESK